MIDFKKIRTYPIKQRKNLVSVKDFLSLDSDYEKHPSKDLEALAAAIVKANGQGKSVIVMFGGHVIKVGVSPFLIDLMKKGYITHLATNGSGAIHDFEVALIGETSEIVAESVETGQFGMAEETGAMMNEAINKSADGVGNAIARLCSKLEFKDFSIFHHANALGIPITVHVAIGTDIIHQHPSCDGARLGAASYHDFKVFTESVSKLEGGVILNIGSAVIMPEVFLKALSISRNLGYAVQHFTAANLDMIKHYRPSVNVVERPTKRGKGFNITGLHQHTIPTLYHYIVEG